MKKYILLVLTILCLTACSNTTTTKLNDKINFKLDNGIVTFIFDDGHETFYRNVFPLFKEKGYLGSVAIDTKRWEKGGSDLMTNDQVAEMQDAGWEIMSHSVSHKNNSKGINSFGPIVKKELRDSKEKLESYGFNINQYVAPNSAFPLDKHKDMLQNYYKAGYTTYVNSKEEPIEKLVMSSPIDFYELHRANMEGISIEKLEEYIDYVDKHKVWLVLYEHQIGGEERYTKTKTLSQLLDYIETKNVEVLTGTDAVETIKANSNRS